MLKKFITLKLLLNEMEEELGLSDLSDAECLTSAPMGPNRAIC